MSEKETLIAESIIAAVKIATVNIEEEKQTEFDRIATLLSAICDKLGDKPFRLLGEEYKLHSSVGRPKGGTSWTPHTSGGGAITIIYAPINNPRQHIHIKYTLSPGFKTGNATLLTEFNPTTIVAGNNVHPAAFRTTDGREGGPIACESFPSSDLRNISQMYKLGFDVLEFFYRKSGYPGNLFEADNRRKIDAGNFRIYRQQWCAFLPTKDRFEFLQAYALLYGHIIKTKQSVMSVSEYLGLEMEYFKKGGRLTGVMLSGKKKPWSYVCYDKKKRVGDMKQSKTLLPEEKDTILQNARFDMTAHSDGLLGIVKAGQRLLKKHLRRGHFADAEWTEEFIAQEPIATAKMLAYAIHVLSHRVRNGALHRRSFSGWVVTKAIEKLDLDLLGTVTRDDFHRLANLKDELAIAWCKDQWNAKENCVKRLAKRSGYGKQTIYNRRNEWIEKYRIDISKPFQFYCDVLFYGPWSVMSQSDRFAFQRAAREGDGLALRRMTNQAADDFDEMRTKIIGKAAAGPLHQMLIKVCAASSVFPSASEAIDAFSQGEGELDDLFEIEEDALEDVA
jgi:hypothetical protein